MGGQSTYTTKLADEIVARISDGEPLRQICRDEHMPGWRTVYDWIQAREDFAARIAHARILGFDAIAEDVLRIADTPLEGERIEESDTGKKVVREDMLGHRKLQIETRLKLLAKWDPKRYGDKLDLNHAGKNGGPIQINISKDDEQL
jgi:hypothetical protein